MNTILSTSNAAPVAARRQSPLAKFIRQNRRAISAFFIFLAVWVIFLLFAPTVFTSNLTYRAIFTTLPIIILMAVPAVFVIAAGEIDLAFPSTVGMGSFAFALCLQANIDPFVGLALAVVVGAAIGAVNGILVNYVGLSSLVATLGMSFFLRGLINIVAQGNSIPFAGIKDTTLYQIFAASTGTIPNQMVWAVLFVLLGWLLFNRHKFGAHVQIVGDNPDSALEMGINVRRVKTMAFMFMGIGAALAGVLSVLVNRTWYPTTGDGYLLTTLAAVFLGGTPTWGGVGTVVGSALGALTITIIEPGLLAVGLSGYYTQFFYGLVVILSLIGHRFNGPRYR
jgi:simple sugar transport system permease protein